MDREEGSDEGENRPDQEGQQKHLSKEKLDCARGRLLEFYLLCTRHEMDFQGTSIRGAYTASNSAL